MPTRPIPMGVVKRTLNTEMAETLAVMFKDGHPFHIPTTGWTETFTGTGTATQLNSRQRIFSGATAASTAVLDMVMWGLDVSAADFARINYDKKLYIVFRYARATSVATAISRLQFKDADTEGALGALGLGIRCDNLVLVGESYGSALGELDLATTLTDSKAYKIVIIHDPSVPKIEWYVGGVLKNTQSTATKIPSGLSSGSGLKIVHSVINGVTAASAGSVLFHPKIWQAE